jgi:hypothetical protein
MAAIGENDAADPCERFWSFSCRVDVLGNATAISVKTYPRVSRVAGSDESVSIAHAACHSDVEDAINLRKSKDSEVPAAVGGRGVLISVR